MSKIVHFIIVIAAITVACNRKALPTITERTKEPPPPAKKTVDVKPDIATGKIIFTNRCGNCHDLPKPEQYTAQRWEGILSYMIPRARLNDEQGVHVTAYLKANAAK
ncbi:MAG: hypothetical protein SGI96_18115 [Bacteroidota bacterium]|nr:hypothetical protein [Bacteroidota bacterium]